MNLDPVTVLLHQPFIELAAPGVDDAALGAISILELCNGKRGN